MDNYKIEKYIAENRQQILTVWAKSVEATHQFLSRTDFEAIKESLKTFDFNDLTVFCLSDENLIIGFVGVAEKKIEMLFLDPKYFGQGLGRNLLSFAVKELGADRLDVNEQNHGAVAFYQKFGFKTFEKTDKDDQGRSYPLLRMKLA